uniref:Uncharacterized protein n=1 Tax=Zea mays TaxID=4577 RepID=A0A804MIZ8_MAIZE
MPSSLRPGLPAPPCRSLLAARAQIFFLPAHTPPPWFLLPGVLPVAGFQASASPTAAVESSVSSLPCSPWKRSELLPSVPIAVSESDSELSCALLHLPVEPLHLTPPKTELAQLLNPLVAHCVLVEGWLMFRATYLCFPFV